MQHTRSVRGGALHRIKAVECSTQLPRDTTCLTGGSGGPPNKCSRDDGSLVGECVAASCRSDVDCDGELLCMWYDAKFEGTSCYGGGYACQSEYDACITYGDCSEGTLCSVNASLVRECRPRPCPD